MDNLFEILVVGMIIFSIVSSFMKKKNPEEVKVPNENEDKSKQKNSKKIAKPKYEPNSYKQMELKGLAHDASPAFEYGKEKVKSTNSFVQNSDDLRKAFILTEIFSEPKFRTQRIRKG